ncbi:hypothetical protein ABZZ74_46825, partial [Streptomyces sp. NPDC006476]
LADRVGLTDALAGVLPSGTTSSWRDRATALVGLVVAIALGARNLLEAEQLQLHHGFLFGGAVSDSTLHRLLSTTNETRRAQREGRTAGASPCLDAAAPAARRLPVSDRRGAVF